MSEVAIHAERLGKRYTLGERAGGWKTLGEQLPSVKSLLSRRRAPQTPAQTADETRSLWAVRDVSFDFMHGEAVGVIGRNGAGKSTLLKLLSRITEPDEGIAHIYGRVGSLLEVGTGFHAELTGRENIFLSGAILGMRRAEIIRKFDEIVEFSEIGRFIDTPVKRYSSGMFMRLAFAVAAHLDPEILLVDEVLAVGDVAFQKKCLGKMDDVAREGRTVVFVSHNLVAVEGLCRRALWLDKGQVMELGSVGTVVGNYLAASASSETERVWHDPATAPGDSTVRLHRAAVRPYNGHPDDPITVRSPLVVELEYDVLAPRATLYPMLNLYNEHGILIFGSAPSLQGDDDGRVFTTGRVVDRCVIPGDLLNDGLHVIEFRLRSDAGTTRMHERELLLFEVRDTHEIRGWWFGEWEGAIRPMLDWTTQSSDAADDSQPHIQDADAGKSVVAP